VGARLTRASHLVDFTVSLPDLGRSVVGGAVGGRKRAKTFVGGADLHAPPLCGGSNGYDLDLFLFCMLSFPSLFFIWVM